MIFLFVSIKVYLVILFTNIKRGGVKMNEQEIYVDNDLLGQQILFRSATGERLGFFNSRIVSMLDFAEDRLNIRTAPKNYEKVREIRYKDIASVDVKRHMSILYIILFILLAIGAIFSMGITLVIDVVLFWSVFGSKLVITTKSGSKYSFVTLWAPKTYQDFTEALRQTVERANTGEYLVANEEKSENIVEKSVKTEENNAKIERKEEQNTAKKVASAEALKNKIGCVSLPISGVKLKNKTGECNWTVLDISLPDGAIAIGHAMTGAWQEGTSYELLDRNKLTISSSLVTELPTNRGDMLIYYYIP